MIRQFSVPAELEQKIESALKAHFGLSLQDSKKLADAVKKLSDFFIANPDGNTPWNESWAQIAYLCYFLPLNHARVQAVVKEAHARDFFSGLENILDFGSGPGTASLALTGHFQKFTLIEKAKDICANFNMIPGATWTATVPTVGTPEKTLAVFSYSLTELSELPVWAKKLEALMILEPSTQDDGRKLQELRRKLIQEGYSIYAPCTHYGACPLLTQSKTDWCHDRIFFVMPDWFEKLEHHLPMKNRTLTTSYLLARKKKPAALAANIGRIVGDHLKEKGKDRQMLCRGSEREFLAWMHKNGQAQDIYRGVLVEIPEDIQKVSNELRVKSPVRALSAD
jgi:small ribosomal subunit Rsm22